MAGARHNHLKERSAFQRRECQAVQWAVNGAVEPCVCAAVSKVNLLHCVPLSIRCFFLFWGLANLHSNQRGKANLTMRRLDCLLLRRIPFCWRWSCKTINCTVPRHILSRFLLFVTLFSLNYHLSKPNMYTRPSLLLFASYF